MHVSRLQILSALVLMVLGIGAIAMARKDTRYSDAPGGIERAIYATAGILMLFGAAMMIAPVVRALAQ